MRLGAPLDRWMDIIAATADSPPRNAPCPCGSGRRYKDCHGALAAAPLAGDAVAASPAVDHPVAALLARARSALALGDNTTAEAAWREVLAADPGDAEALFHLGNLERERGHHPIAIAHYRQALLRVPGHAGVLNNLGLACEAQGQTDQAEACYREVLTAAPSHPDALANLASIQVSQENFAAAAASYRRLFAIRREAPAAVWVRRALAQRRSGDLAGTEDSLREAARIAPDDADVQINLASACVERQLWAAAEPALLRTLAVDPAHPYALSMLAHARQQRCDWRGLDSLFGAVGSQLEAPDADRRCLVNPFWILAMPASPRAQLNAARRWARGFAPPSPAPRPTVVPQPGERLRVGFVSSDFRNHPMVHLSLDFWERIDRGRFETIAYGLLPEDTSATGARITRAFDRFADVSAESAAATAQRIRNDRIAILLDLNGYTTHSREQLFALRPAPIQVNSIGFPGTLGADWYDYILVDRFAAPEATQPFYTERLWHMPHSFYPSDTRRAPHGPAPSRVECGLPAQGFVFCCFNKAFKILPDVFALWMRLLHAVPGSVLWLLETDPAPSVNLRREAAAAGVDPARLVFAPRIPPQGHLARHAAADLFVDTFPYGAHTTTNDALLMGLPVLTCAGETLVSRISGSQLHAIGLPELVTADLTDYEALALALARDPARLAALRARLAANRRTYPLFDTDRFREHLEAAYERMCKRVRAGLPPEAFTVG